jgi:hypothetical protein
MVADSTGEIEDSACARENLVDENVSLWIHGYTHTSIDYKLRGTRVIANPRGYFSESQAFNGNLSSISSCTNV